MAGADLVSAIVQILVSGITGIATGVGTGLSTLASNIFFTTVGEGSSATTQLSVLGTCIIAFAAISLGLALCRLTLPGGIKLVEKREHFNINANGSYSLNGYNTCNA